MADGVDSRDVHAVIAGIFDVNAKLEQIATDVDAIRRLLEDGDEEEEAEDH
jgi:hypothetical protein